MSIAYNDLVSDVCGYLQIRTSDSGKFQVDNSLNRSQDHLLTVLSEKYLRNAVRNRSGNLVANEPAYEWPSDFRRFLSMRLSYSAAIDGKSVIGEPAEQVDDISLYNRSNIDMLPTLDYPKVSAGVEIGFEIRPIPASDQTNGWLLKYITSLPTISSTQDCLFNDDLRNLLTFYATSLSASVEGYSLVLSEYFYTLYKDELERLQPKMKGDK